MAEFFTKCIILFNFITNALIILRFNLLQVQSSIVRKKIFQNDQNAKLDEREDDGEKICENCEKTHFMSEAIS